MMVLKQGSMMIILAAYPWESLTASKNKKKGDAIVRNVFLSSESH